MSKLKFLVAALLISASLPMTASLLAGATDGTTLSNNPLYAGQSFILGGTDFSEESTSQFRYSSLANAPLIAFQGGSFDHITFNFYSASNQPVAGGTGYLFDQAYTGTPSQLSSSSPGLVGIASSNGSVYTFAPTLTLSAGVDYFFYEDALLQPLTGGSSYEDGNSYASPYSCVNFSGPYPSLNFQVNGDPVPLTVTPEPSTLTLLCTGLLGMAALVRRLSRRNGHPQPSSTV